jgi:uncharacterized membrane protein YczE
LETGVSARRPQLGSRLRVAGILLIIGLIIEIFSFLWDHPLTFMAFLVIGCTFIGLGIVLFLWTLVTLGKAEPSA